MRPVRGQKIQGVMGGDGEMSYIDVNALRPESVSAAMLDGAVSGAVSGASMTAFPIGVGALIWSSYKGEGQKFTEGIEKLSAKPLWIGASIIAGTALIMGAVKAITAGKQAQVHNAWSAKVLDHMQQREAIEDRRLTMPAATYAEQAQQPTATHSEQAQLDKVAAAEPAHRG